MWIEEAGWCGPGWASPDTKETAAKYGIQHVTTDLAESLALKVVDAVILCTPTVIGEKKVGDNVLDEQLNKYSDIR